MSKKFKRVVLHFGGDKTGSTSIQNFLSTMRQNLIDKQLVAYPPPDSWHATLGSFFCDWPENYVFNYQRGISSKKILEEESRQCVENLNLWLETISSCECLVFSYEGFVDLDIEALNRFREFCFLYSDNVQVVLYVRSPLSYAVSGISQRMKQGAATLEAPVSPYKTYCEKICEVFGKKNIIVRPFVSSLLKDGDVVADFTEILNISDHYQKETAQRHNESLSFEAIYIGNRLLNRLEQQHVLFTQEEFYTRIGSVLATLHGEKIKLTKQQISEVLAASFEHTEYLKNEFNIVFNEDERDYFDQDDMPNEKREFLNSIGEMLAQIITNGFVPRELRSDDILMREVELHYDGNDIIQGQLLTFEVPFSVTRPISELEIGIHIFDANKKWAFGTNSTLLKQVQQNVETGSYRVFHRISANLPVGMYTAGFAFAERTETGVNELYWTDVACEFRVSRAQTKTSVGYVDLPATINLIRNGNT